MRNTRLIAAAALLSLVPIVGVATPAAAFDFPVTSMTNSSSDAVIVSKVIAWTVPGWTGALCNGQQVAVVNPPSVGTRYSPGQSMTLNMVKNLACNSIVDVSFVGKWGSFTTRTQVFGYWVGGADQRSFIARDGYWAKPSDTTPTVYAPGTPVATTAIVNQTGDTLTVSNMSSGTWPGPGVDPAACKNADGTTGLPKMGQVVPPGATINVSLINREQCETFYGINFSGPHGWVHTYAVHNPWIYGGSVVWSRGVYSGSYFWSPQGGSVLQ